MEVFKDFGFEPGFFIAQIVNFLILAFVFKKFLYKPILKVLRDREKKIAQGVADADEAHRALETAEAKKDEIIKAATEEAEKIINETKKSAEELRDSLTVSSKKEAQKIITEAKEAAEAEFQKEKNQIEGLALDMSKKILDKILSETFTQSEREKIVQRNIKILEKYD